MKIDVSIEELKFINDALDYFLMELQKTQKINRQMVELKDQIQEKLCLPH
jgi:hypothetical protein